MVHMGLLSQVCQLELFQQGGGRPGLPGFSWPASLLASSRASSRREDREHAKTWGPGIRGTKGLRLTGSNKQSFASFLTPTVHEENFLLLGGCLSGTRAHNRHEGKRNEKCIRWFPGCRSSLCLLNPSSLISCCCDALTLP